MPSNEFQILQEPWWRFRQHHGKILLENKHCTQMEGQFYELQTMGLRWDSFHPFETLLGIPTVSKTREFFHRILWIMGYHVLSLQSCRWCKFSLRRLGWIKHLYIFHIYIYNAVWCWNGQNILGWCKNTRELTWIYGTSQLYTSIVSTIISGLCWSKNITSQVSKTVNFTSRLVEIPRSK